ncbi:hypothetical protein [Pseudarthrobacter sp. PH31-O2]|uniref:hypothetical protein n=1 Tax=Pseudarthrobacter sp. PH31-O2 TaxID=3046206 RepID=UPI0024BABC30|nr:hypothetical protein [Pseudarthrobacter sp. PH31-O2]MDJ0353378.1 hypothetical protein [Pseudarthrobacter sp. PH31-O2]
MDLNFGDLPGWITTLLAIGGVLYGGYNLKKLTRERQREQANRIYFGSEFDDHRTFTHVINLSDAPITSVSLYFREYPKWTWQEHASRPLLMMGDDWKRELLYPDNIPLVVSYVAFTDAANRHWYKLSNGKLWSYDDHKSLHARVRYFPSTWMIKLRTYGMTPTQRDAWLRNHGFIAGLFRWGFGKEYDDW